ncbi:unnamed protein product, partial [Mesorhabditis spiculigera]
MSLTTTWTQAASIFIDLCMPFAVLADVSIYRTFGQKSSLCHVFLMSMQNMFLCNIFMYLIELLFKDPASFGWFIPFWQWSGKVVGKLVVSTLHAWGNSMLLFSMVIAFSRMWCIVWPVSFKKKWSVRNARYVNAVVWGYLVVQSLHIWIFVDCRSYPKTNISYTFNTVTPNILLNLQSTYLRNIVLIFTVLCYIILGGYLRSYSRMANSTLWRNTKRIIISQLLIVIPRVILSGFTIYANLEAFFPELNLVPLDLEFYYLIIKLGNVGYGILASIVIFYVFPQTWQPFKRVICRNASRSTDKHSQAGSAPTSVVNVTNLAQPRNRSPPTVVTVSTIDSQF